jgi:voltage-gated potassium channel
VIRLYDLWAYIRGGEILLLASLSIVSVIFGAYNIYLAEAGKPDSNISNLNDGFWWSIETITNVAYGEYYPVTVLGRIVASAMMFAAIAFLWSSIGLIGSALISRKIKRKDTTRSTTTTVVDETKDIIKNKIDSIEELESNELEDMIRITRSLNSKSRSKPLR